jgi:hypothetical protein
MRPLVAIAQVAAALLLLMAFVYVPVFKDILGQTALSARQLLLVGVPPALFLGAEGFEKLSRDSTCAYLVDTN